MDYELFSLSILQKNHYNLTLSVASWLLAIIQENEWLYSEEKNMLLTALANINESPLPRAQLSTFIRQDKRNFDNINKERFRCDSDTDFNNAYKLKIFTDYEYAKQLLVKSNNCTVVNSLSEANFLLTALHITDFYGLPLDLRVNQFPYEGGFVRKDLLTLTIRAYCYKEGDIPPCWWLPAYDLSTEFHYFSNEIKNRQLNNLSNNWILKPAQGTRAVGHYILLDSSNMIEEAAFAAPNIPINVLTDKIKSKYQNINGVKERVAQLLIYKPLLVRGLKFDLRTFVFVRSFYPLEAYLHTHHYARLANKPYDTNQLTNNEIVLTVNAYNEDEEIANRQMRIYQDDLAFELSNEYNNFDYELMFDNLIDMISELFIGLSKSIGSWPNSSAYYAIDVMFDTENVNSSPNFIPQSKLLEINFMGDWEAARLGSKSEDIYNQWVEDLITCLCTTETPNTNRHIRLQENWRQFRLDYRK